MVFKSVTSQKHGGGKAWQKKKALHLLVGTKQRGFSLPMQIHFLTNWLGTKPLTHELLEAFYKQLQQTNPDTSSQSLQRAWTSWTQQVNSERENPKCGPLKTSQDKVNILSHCDSEVSVSSFIVWRSIIKHTDVQVDGRVISGQPGSLGEGATFNQKNLLPK